MLPLVKRIPNTCPKLCGTVWCSTAQSGVLCHITDNYIRLKQNDPIKNYTAVLDYSI